jgi:hypothetical protein
MPYVEQIENAITAHALWKTRLHKAIGDGKSEYTPAGVSVDDQCEFGRWLHSLPAADQEAQAWQDVHERHATFHQEAGAVLELALGGKKTEADTGLAIGSPFAKTSIELTRALMRWKLGMYQVFEETS